MEGRRRQGGEGGGAQRGGREEESRDGAGGREGGIKMGVHANFIILLINFSSSNPPAGT